MTFVGPHPSTYLSILTFLRSVTRALKHSWAPTDAAIVAYGTKFSELKAALLERAAINTEIAVLRVLNVTEQIGAPFSDFDTRSSRLTRAQRSSSIYWICRMPVELDSKEENNAVQALVKLS